MGYFLDRFGWGVWVSVIIPFSVIGAVLMLTLWTTQKEPRADAAEGALIFHIPAATFAEDVRRAKIGSRKRPACEN